MRHRFRSLFMICNIGPDAFPSIFPKANRTIQAGQFSMGATCSKSDTLDGSNPPSLIQMLVSAGCCFKADTMSIKYPNSTIRVTSHHLPRAGTVPEEKLPVKKPNKALRAYHSEEITTISEPSPSRPNYHIVRERLLKWTPSSYHCRLFCGGSACKYCDPNAFPANLQALPGLFSTWVTERILASARPTADTIKRFDLFKEFKSRNIVSVINLQRPYEHSQCGLPFPPNMEFAYNPEDFMKEKFFHYNFGWPDFGASTVACLLDMVKVLIFALTQGKVAIHCHAGLGRTGVLICAFLMWDKNYTPTEAIQLVRNRRPGSVQTTPQVDLLFEFDDFLKTLRPIFDSDLTFEKHLKRQRVLLHGLEGRILKHIPKIVFVCCERLLELIEIKENGALRRRLRRLLRHEDPEDGADTVQSLVLSMDTTTHGLVSPVDPTRRVLSSTDTRHGPLSSASWYKTNSSLKLTDLHNPNGEIPTSNNAVISIDQPCLLVKEYESDKKSVGMNEAQETSREKLLRAAMETVLRAEGPCGDQVSKLKMGLTTESFSTRWDQLMEETSMENLLFILRDWFVSLKEPSISPEFEFDYSNGNVQTPPKIIKKTLLYCADTFNQLSRGDAELMQLFARYLRQCFTQKLDSSAPIDCWFVALVNGIDERIS